MIGKTIIYNFILSDTLGVSRLMTASGCRTTTTDQPIESN